MPRKSAKEKAYEDARKNFTQASRQVREAKKALGLSTTRKPKVANCEPQTRPPPDQ